MSLAPASVNLCQLDCAHYEYVRIRENEIHSIHIILQA